MAAMSDVSVVILAGGMGTRLAEETSLRPKPMVEISGKPLLWHLMNFYSAHGFDDFVLACGYKSEFIKEYFRSLYIHNSDLVIDVRNGSCDPVNSAAPPWRIAIVDTGLQTMTGGRLLRLRNRIGNRTFMATYGDGLSDVDVNGLLEFHRSHKRLATLTAVRPPARFGGLVLRDTRVCQFTEKSQLNEGWINGGFFVFEPGIFDYLYDDDTVLERSPLERLAADGQLMAFRHTGFWQPMDTLREKQFLERLWESGNAPWKVW
jgi:glucose-1-phosphate cytidylyltransferase